MTTIACDRKKMASDSRVTVFNDYLYTAVKIQKVKGMIVGGAGDGENCNLLIEWAKSGFKGANKPAFRKKSEDDDEDDPEAILLILKDDGIYLLTNSDSEPEKIGGEFYAIGTGHQAAMTALKLKQTPEQAVELACEVDNQSGLPVQVLSLKEE